MLSRVPFFNGSLWTEPICIVIMTFFMHEKSHYHYTYRLSVLTGQLRTHEKSHYHYTHRLSVLTGQLRIQEKAIITFTTHIGSVF